MKAIFAKRSSSKRWTSWKGLSYVASVGTISIGLKVATRQFSAGLTKARADVASFAGQVQSMGRGLLGLPAALGALGGTALAGGLYEAVKLGSDLNESLSKTGVIFGDSAGLVTASADEMGAKFGTVKTTFLEAAANIGQIGKASGLTTNDAAKLGSQFAKLAADVSSISNVPFADVLQAMQSGLVGAAEPLQKFGVLLDENTLKLEASRLGIAMFGKELTQAQKVQTRAIVISEQLAYATGDMERTAGGFANAFRGAKGRLTNFLAEAGLQLQPIAESLLSGLNNALDDFSKRLAANKDAIKTWAENAIASGGVVFQTWTTLGAGVGKFADVLQTVGLGFVGLKYAGIAFAQSFLQALSSVIKFVDDFLAGLRGHLVDLERLAGNFGLDLDLADKLPKLKIDDGLKTIDDAVKRLGKEASGAWQEFQAALAQPPPSEGIAAWFETIKTKADAAVQKARELAATPKIEEAGPSRDLFVKRSIEDAKIALEQKKKLGEFAKKSFEEQQRPLEKLALKFKELEEAKRAGFLDQNEVDRIKQGDARELVSHATKSGAGGAVEARSAEAFNAFVAYQSSRQDPLKSLPDLSRLGVEEAHKQTILLERIAKLTGSTYRSVFGQDLPEN